MKLNVWLFLAIITILATNGVSAFGISQDYHENSTITLMQGDTYVQHVTIQNDLPVPLQIKFTVNSEYTTVNGAREIRISVPAKSIDTVVPITITIPENAEPNSTVSVLYTAQPVIEEQGTVTMAIRLSDSFIIHILERPPPWWRPYAIAGGILVVLLIMFALGSFFAKRQHRTHNTVTHSTHPSVTKKESPERVTKSVHKTMHDIIMMVAELDDKTLESKLRSGEIAKLVFEHVKDPETYHTIRSAKTRRELLRALREV